MTAPTAAVASLGFAVPAYRRPENLDIALASLVPAARAIAAPIYVPDDSCDGTNVAVVEKWQRSYSNIVHEINERNLGIDRNIDKAIAGCPADYVHVMGEDDVILPGFVESVMRVIAGTSPGHVICSYVYVSNSYEPLSATPVIAGMQAPACLRTVLPEYAWALGFIGAHVFRRDRYIRCGSDGFGTFFNHLVRIISYLSPDEPLGYVATPVVGNRADDESTPTWSGRRLDVVFGLERALRSSMRERYTEAQIARAVAMCRRHLGYAQFFRLLYWGALAQTSGGLDEFWASLRGHIPRTRYLMLRAVPPVSYGLLRTLIPRVRQAKRYLRRRLPARSRGVAVVARQWADAGCARRERLACLIAGRNLGDIVILSQALRDLVASRYAERYVVWTRPQMAWIFAGIPDSEVVCSAFPVGTRKEFGLRGLLGAIAAVTRIRRLRPSVSLDFVGDIRERTFGRLLGGERHLHIGWERGHPYNNLIRNPFGVGHPLVNVPASVPNVYDAYGMMLRALLEGEPALRAHSAKRARAEVRGEGDYIVGLHPFASQACKAWPADRWARLARGLLSSGCTVVAFSAPEEHESLRTIFADLADRVSLSSGSIVEFAGAVSGLDLLIGLDSFSVHLAHRVGTPSITINAGAPKELWAVPDGRTLAESGGCRHYPCYNVAPCRDTPFENACVKAISEAQVLSAVMSLRSAARADDIRVGA